MRKQTSLYIPAPCHEDWNGMTPTQQGKFCASCNKQVVDFSLMSDGQILNFLSGQSGKLCGRFDAEQLQRPLVETKIEKKKSWWMALTMPLLFLFERSEGHVNEKVKTDTTISPVDKHPEIMGKLVYHPKKQITVTGRVVDEKNAPVPYATVMQKGTLVGVVADSAGNFTIRVGSDVDVLYIAAAAVGYESVEQQLQITQDTMVNITLRVSATVSGEVVIMGGLNSYHPVKPIDTIKTAVKKIFKTSKFMSYPNPASKGSIVHLEIKKIGEYQLQLLDNQSKLIKVEEINAASDKFMAFITLPSTIPAGIYYLRLMDERNKKQYTEKLIIQ